MTGYVWMTVERGFYYGEVLFCEIVALENFRNFLINGAGFSKNNNSAGSSVKPVHYFYIFHSIASMPVLSRPPREKTVYLPPIFDTSTESTTHCEP